jgi:DNA-binding CsgD family transcriptional regulator
VPKLDDVRRQVRALAVAGLPLDELWRRTDAVFRRAVPWDASAWGQVDPATLLSTGCQVLGLPFEAGRERLVFGLEHDDGDVNRLTDLLRLTPPGAGLHESTGGHPESARRYEALLRPLGFADDLRVALVDDGVCWASLYAYRREGVFRPDEVALVAALSADLAEGVRLTLLRADAAAATAPGAPGLLLLAPDGSVTAISELAAEWLRALAPDGGVPPVVTAVAAALHSSTPGPRSARVRAADGRWLVVHASHVEGTGGALIVEAARPLEVAPVLCAAYGLSERERDVVGFVLRGESNRATARALGISEHTVKEHLKSVFAKVGVLSRGELAARLLHEQYLPRRAAGVPASSAGWFRETA